MARDRISPLHEWHSQHQAVMTSVSGWEMPQHYATTSIDEHKHVRSTAGLFDLSHMSKFIFSGTNAAEALSCRITTNISMLKPGRCRYGFLLNDNGGIEDDFITYRMAEDTFLLVGNSFCRENDLAALQHDLPGGISVTDVTENLAQIDLQGPESFDILCSVLPGHWRRLPYYGFLEFSFENQQILASRTGYTGELGVELFVPRSAALKLWETISADNRVHPIGLEARNTLRLEAGLPLNGADLDSAHTPAEAGFGGVLTSQAAYTGKDEAYAIREKLSTLRLEDSVVPTKGDSVLDLQGNSLGHITSAVYAPSLDCPIAFAYIRADAALEQTVSITTSGTKAKAYIVSTPAYSKGTARAAIL